MNDSARRSWSYRRLVYSLRSAGQGAVRPELPKAGCWRKAAPWALGGALLAAVLLAAVLGRPARPPYEGKSVDELERMLYSQDSAARVQGALGLGLHGAEARAAVPALSRALASPDPLLRMQAALALGRIGPDAREAAGKLTAALGDADWTVRRQAVLALAQIGPDARFATAEIARLQVSDPNGLVRKAAAEALETLR